MKMISWLITERSKNLTNRKYIKEMSQIQNHRPFKNSLIKKEKISMSKRDKFRNLFLKILLTILQHHSHRREMKMNSSIKIKTSKV